LIVKKHEFTQHRCANLGTQKKSQHEKNSRSCLRSRTVTSPHGEGVAPQPESTRCAKKLTNEAIPHRQPQQGETNKSQANCKAPVQTRQCQKITRLLEHESRVAACYNHGRLPCQTIHESKKQNPLLFQAAGLKPIG
jgi:hypothetical protein